MTFTDGTGQYMFTGFRAIYEMTFSLPGFNAPARLVQVSRAFPTGLDVAPAADPAVAVVVGGAFRDPDGDRLTLRGGLVGAGRGRARRQ